MTGERLTDYAAGRVVLAYAVFGALWILLSDKAVELVFNDAKSIVAAGILKGWLFVAVTSALLWILLRRQLPAAGDAPAARPPGRLTFIVTLALVSMAIVAATLAGILKTIDHHKDGEVARLQAIAELKSEQVAGWLAERRSDAEFLRSSTFLSGLQVGRLGALGALSGDEVLKSRLGQFCKGDTYGNALLLGRNGQLLWDVAGDGAVLSGALRAAVSRAVAGSEIVIVGPYRDEADVLRLDFVVPLPAAGGHPGPVVVLRSDPAASLNALLQVWPTPTDSGETLIFRRDGDDALFLNELRHRKDTAVKMRVPLSERRQLAAQILNAEARPGTLVEGIDYRRVPAIGVAQRVAGTDWYLIARMDLDEINAAGAHDSKNMALAGALALFVVVIAALLYRQHQELLVEQRLRGDQAEKLHALQLLDAIADNSEDAIFAMDRENRFILFNNAAARKTGKAAAEIVGRDETALFPTEIARRQMAVNRRVMDSGRGESIVETLPMADGEHTYLVAKAPLRDEHGRVFGIFGIARDITELKRSETALKRISEDLASTLQAIPDLLFELDSEGHYLDVKATQERLLYAPPDRLKGRTVHEILPPEAAQTVMDALAAAEQSGTDFGRRIELPLAEGTHSFELSVARKTGATPDQPASFILLSRDITERRLAEDELRSRNAELERFNRAMVGRELNMIDLKRQVNELSRALGRQPPFDLDFVEGQVQRGGEAGP